ncbi:hypothetical protein RRG08_064666 [Elysia crispata]|uniref:Uncharacterized protein n=1 Tax=Elysia crispata TaxID=231223 RepID=A0AAE1B940_9GAST|nr:hypothetical protein RRG08_064666 [Elysia crispata]
MGTLHAQKDLQRQSCKEQSWGREDGADRRMDREKLRCHSGNRPQPQQVEPAGPSSIHHAAPPTTLAGYGTSNSSTNSNLVTNYEDI